MHTSIHYLLHSGKNSKIAYYLRAVLREMVPAAILRRHLDRELFRCRGLYDQQYVEDRVEYYCKLVASATLGSEAKPLSEFHKKGNSSTYYYDSREIVRWFSPDLLWQYLFGDIRDIPDSATVVKSRSTLVDNANSVLLNLDKCRHFVFLKDKIPFEEKKDMALFRGQIGTRENRRLFVERFADNRRIDAANTLAKGGLFSTNVDGKATAPRLSLYDHLRYRYIMALEGNDVASNLKWIMSSNSLAVTPPMTCETWFMEGRLQGGVHYVEIKDDFSDLEEKMDYYSSHIDEAHDISRAANEYVDQFHDKRRERYIALLVMKRYFEMTSSSQPHSIIQQTSTHK